MVSICIFMVLEDKQAPLIQTWQPLKKNKSKSVLFSQVFLYSSILALSNACWWIHFIQKIQLPTPVAAAMFTDNDITSCSLGRDNDKGCHDGSKQKVAKLKRLLWMPGSVMVE